MWYYLILIIFSPVFFAFFLQDFLCCFVLYCAVNSIFLLCWPFFLHFCNILLFFIYFALHKLLQFLFSTSTLSSNHPLLPHQYLLPLLIIVLYCPTSCHFFHLSVYHKSGFRVFTAHMELPRNFSNIPVIPIFVFFSAFEWESNWVFFVCHDRCDGVSLSILWFHPLCRL